MKAIIICVLLIVTTSVVAANLQNESGRWLQVDCVTSTGKVIATLNLRSGDNKQFPNNCYSLKIRNNGRSIVVGHYSTIRITPQEELLGESK